MIDIGTQQRIAIGKETGRKFLVKHIDLDLGYVYCWQYVLGFGYGPKKKTLKTEGDLKFYRREVTIQTITLSLNSTNELFEQYKNDRLDDLMSGDYIVVKDKLSAKIQKSSLGERHPTLSCPVHGCNMRIYNAFKGGQFWGCPTKGETGCRITYSTSECDVDGNLKMYDPDRVLE
jgi:hypothetical protein